MNDHKCRLLSISVALAAGAAAVAGPGCSLPPPPPPAPMVLAIETHPFALAIDSTTVYVATSLVEPVLTVPLDGGQISWLDVRADEKALAVDQQNLYWSDGTGVFGCNKSNCDASRFTLAADDAFQVVVAAGTVYWSTTGDATGTQRLMSARPGQTPVQLATGGIYAFAVDETNVYWLDQGALTTTPGIKATPIDGGPISTIAATHAYETCAIALGPNDIYYTTADGRLLQVPKRGGPSQVLLSSLNTYPIGLATDGTNVYVTSSNTVVSTPAQGGPVTVLVEHMGGPSGITLYDDSVYIADEYGGAVLKVPK